MAIRDWPTPLSARRAMNEAEDRDGVAILVKVESPMAKTVHVDIALPVDAYGDRHLCLKTWGYAFGATKDSRGLIWIDFCCRIAHLRWHGRGSTDARPHGSASRMIGSLPNPQSPRNRAGHRSRGIQSSNAHRPGAKCLDVCSLPATTSTSNTSRVPTIE